MSRGGGHGQQLRQKLVQVYLYLLQEFNKVMGQHYGYLEE